ncbi:SANT and BTB domain regulator of class switch recombination [Athalia rosae]|uniref:SANT and BTB domain regulator of class switch recombination n=1 Tax=Athalia rosae TaxID=37344 RepID=UPI002033D806|nr:SANT and BTB domain regulator of class switch recombination [Athalia rosae]
MYPNLFKKFEPIEKYNDQSKGDNTSSSTSLSSNPSTTTSEGSFFPQESTQENKTSTATRVPNCSSNLKIPSPRCSSLQYPSNPRSVDSSPLKSSGMYVKRLPERLQRLQDEKKCPELSVQTFFDFMRTAYQVNDSFEELATTLSTKSEIDWTKLAKTDLISQTLISDEENVTAEVDREIAALNITGEKSTATEEIKFIEFKNPDNDIGTTIIETSKIANAENEHRESPCNIASNAKYRRHSLRKHNLQKAGIQLLSTNEEPPLSTIHYPDKHRLHIQKNDAKKNEASNDQQNQPLLSTTKKNKILMAETFTEQKEQLLAKIMKRKLGDILHEGILDSVLPYMLPKPVFSQPVIKKSITNMEIKKTAASAINIDSRITSTIIKDKDKEKNKYRRRSFDNEVEIHVCDEAKNIKKDFRCPQKLLVQKMCYFADVTAGQKLEEMDISVHCDIVIFDWLMRWVKKDIIKKSEWPVFEANNVIPIMVSASFLQMEPLLEDCLIYCHNNLSEVLKTSAILTCLNDNLLTRLATLFTNVDVELLKDKKDKIQSRLFCKLIVSLADSTPDEKRGHYSSLATLFKCGKCGKNVVRSISDSIPCVPSAMRIDTKGNIHSMHTRDISWTLNDYIIALRTELRSWRRVYWRLWGDCHFLMCRQCGIYFPIHQMDWCCYHPEIPQFFANEQQRSSPFPLGRYPCCSQRAYRFETLPSQEGCRFKEHIPAVVTDLDETTLNIFTAHRDIIALEPPQLFFPEKITRLVARDPNLEPGKLACKETMWWDGVELVPPRSKLGLLGKIWGGSGVRQVCQTTDSIKSSRKMRRQASQMTDTSSPGSSLAGSDDDDGATACGESSADDDTDNSEESHAWPPLRQVRKFKRKTRYYAAKRSDGGRSWSANLTVRYNQDNQRDFEERAALQMAALLTKRTAAECSMLPRTHNHNRQHAHGFNLAQPIGGTYVRLEAEFREQLAQTYKCKGSSQVKGSARVKSSKIPQ